MPKTLSSLRLHSAVAALLLSVSFGCSADSEVAVIAGKVTFQGTPKPSGSSLIFDDGSRSVTTMITIGEGGAFSVTAYAQLPAGSYSVAVIPPAQSDSSAEVDSVDYDKLMSGGGTVAENVAQNDYPVPEKYRDTRTTDQRVEFKAGSQQLDIDLGG